MTRLIASELLKLRTTRAFWVFVIAAVVLATLVSVPVVAFSSLLVEEELRALLSNIGVAGVVALLLGVVGMTGEHRHGTLTPTLLVAPRRIQVVVAKALAHALAGALLGLAAFAILALIALPWWNARGGEGVPAGEVLLIGLGVALNSGLLAALGVGLGALLRNQIVAIVVPLVYILMVEPAIGVFSDPVATYGLSSVTSSLSRAPSEDLSIPMGLAGLILLGYAAALIAAGAWATARQDVA